ncbi:MAG: NAD(P)H-binding protein [Candidatus Dormibacteria bacterium]
MVGATGFTGGLVVDECLRRGLGVRLIGRNRARLEAVAERVPLPELVVVDTWDAPTLSRALERAAVVIACAGPFAEAGIPVAEAAVAAGVPYLDSSGEEPFARELLDRLDGPARERGVALYPGFGFDYVPGELALAAAADALAGDGAVELRRAWVAYRPPGSASRGTRLTAARAAGSPAAYRLGESRQEPLGHTRWDAPFAQAGPVRSISIGSFEALFLPRRHPVHEVRTFMVLPGAAVAALPVLRLVAGSPLRGLVRGVMGAGPPAPTGESRGQRWSAVAQVTAADGQSRIAEVSGLDVYGATARFLVAGALLASERTNRGVLAAWDLVPDATSFLAGCGAELSLAQPAPSA